MVSWNQRGISGTSRVSIAPGGARRAFVGTFAVALRYLLGDERFARAAVSGIDRVVDVS